RPPMSRMGPISDAERAQTMAASPLAGRYDVAVDRDSAHEMLAARAEAKTREAALAEEMLNGSGAGSGRRYEPNAPARTRQGSTRQRPSLSEELARTVVKQLGTRQGQRMVRGILGGLFGRR